MVSVLYDGKMVQDPYSVVDQILVCRCRCVSRRSRRRVNIVYIMQQLGKGRKFQFSDFHSFPQIYILTSRFDHYCPFHSFQEQQRTLSLHGRGCSGIEYLPLLPNNDYLLINYLNLQFVLVVCVILCQMPEFLSLKEARFKILR